MVIFHVPKFLLWAIAVTVLLQTCRGYKEISGLLDESIELSHNEIIVLTPLFTELQLQYDIIAKTEPKDKDNKLFQQQYEATLLEFEQQLSNIFPQEGNNVTTIYNTTLPTVEEIIGKNNLSLMTQEQQIEYLDLQNILQDSLDEAQSNLNDLVARALTLEATLLKINKPRVTTLLFKALKIGYKAAGRIGRAAYCSYSHIPQLNTSLHSLYDGVDCYLYTTSLVVHIQNETYHTIKTVKKNALELAAVYKKVAHQNSLMGKILSVILNITKISKNILDTISIGNHVLDSIENELPMATEEVVNCTLNFAIKIPHIIDSVSNVTQCIMLIDDTNNYYDFMTSEDEYYKEIPSLVYEDAEDNDIK